MLRQRLQLKLQAKLSPQQIQLMKLLQVPTVALEQRIKEHLPDLALYHKDDELFNEIKKENKLKQNLLLKS